MDCFAFFYEGDSRNLRKIILGVLNSGVAENVYKLNYVQNFCAFDKNVKKNEGKIVLVYSKDEAKLMDFVSKNFPQLLRIYVK